MKTALIAIQVCSAIAAGVAAVMWWRSAVVETPDFTIIGTFSPGPDQIAPFAKWAQRTADLSRRAAIWAGVSAILAAAATLLQSRMP